MKCFFTFESKKTVDVLADSILHEPNKYRKYHHQHQDLCLDDSDLPRYLRLSVSHFWILLSCNGGQITRTTEGETAFWSSDRSSGKSMQEHRQKKKKTEPGPGCQLFHHLELWNHSGRFREQKYIDRVHCCIGIVIAVVKKKDLERIVNFKKIFRSSTKPECYILQTE